MPSKTLSGLELRIIRELTRGNNISSIAKSLNISKETVRRRIKELEGPLGRLRLRIDLYAIGLSQIVLISEDLSVGSRLLRSPYLRSIAYMYKFNKRYSLVNITPPLRALDNYVTYLKSLSSEKCDIYITYSPIYWIPDLAYIKNFNDPFLYDWSELRKDIERAPTELKISLKAQATGLTKTIDRIDLFILRELEINPLKSIRSIARDLGISQQLAHYHYKRHVTPVILSKNLRVFLKRESAIKGLLVVKFNNNRYLNKFVNVLVSLPHCSTILLDVLKPTLLLSYQVYAHHYTDFVKAMFELKEVGIVKEIENYGLFAEPVFNIRVLPWERAFMSGNWIVDEFIKDTRSLDNFTNRIEVRLWESK